ncbi:DEAD/DEAH box helicase [Francisella tularensis]|uniref:DEAD/DEAH box helicase n=2 Tax=Francisella tularensis TaxID=263 RepID=UPI00028DD123|nr:DEAD/DEAH box helicase [Francisella tularensis]AJI63334.1 DEAD/DEAH box helicase family protein [Francisella tularensis subsp. tularensis]AKH91777.1 DEAD/DEAH box helicase [Francisella tularensis subsp. tularensis WY-00W4114]AKU74277.1 DEAD/DEAH box helicase family protein [Francisella tularensis subsp. tularensis]EKM90765.1 DEAD/DEAH box helicase [Francisella tularensis subsp. tularensis 70102010]EKM92056.1 DEAD/DEAH box helicase [Francisella tularensis subsp. tularensis 80700103]
MQKIKHYIAGAKNFKNELINYLEELSKDRELIDVYAITLLNVFDKIAESLDEDNIINKSTGIKETIVWNKLFDFQKDGVLGAIDKLEKYNGCIIADSVGLGKTFEALAVIKYYELRNSRVLVLCPKKLRDNWIVFKANDKRNLLVDDHFRYDILNHTDLSREKGLSGEIDLATLNWGNYDLVVLDESHNFRNIPTKKEKEETRYSKLMNQIIKSGVNTKVLMLSATPVNNKLSDLGNQLAIITKDNPTALQKYGIENIDNTLRTAQARFNDWLKLDVATRTTQDLLDNLNADYFNLLDTFTIARSREHIKKYYNNSAIGGFPKRLEPKNIYSAIDINNKFPNLAEINESITMLELPIYSPLLYVKPSKMLKYEEKYDTVNFKQVDRERSLINLMRVNILKRMESSINSFYLTVNKILKKTEDILSKLDKIHELEELDLESFESLDFDSPQLEEYVTGSKTKVLIQDMDLIKYRQALETDREILEELATQAVDIDAKRDKKLQELKLVVDQKSTNPINASNKKIIIFTAFADTAMYIYENIHKDVLEKYGVHTALVTGSGRNKTTMSGVKPNDLNELLTNFSPISKSRDKLDPNETREIDILIATDCISEGQNLQDCDYLVNYDIHWNPVRIIQRFGRVDRIGSINEQIQLVNFWADMDLDEYINLESRVKGRMTMVDVTATGEDNVLSTSIKKEMQDLQYHKKQLKELQEKVVDLDEISGGISLTDITLNDYKMDLTGMKSKYTNLEVLPKGIFSVLDAQRLELKSGAIFCLKDLSGKNNLDNKYAMYPYFLVYVADDGSIVQEYKHTKKSLNIIRHIQKNETGLDTSAIAKFNQKTKKASNMKHYKTLMEKAIQHIIGKTEEKGIDSLFSTTPTVVANTNANYMTDFEVVSYVIFV